MLRGKNPPANAGDVRGAGSIPGSGRSPGGRNGTPLQKSCWKNTMDRGPWGATVYGVTHSQTWLSICSLLVQWFLTRGSSECSGDIWPCLQIFFFKTSGLRGGYWQQENILKMLLNILQCMRWTLLQHEHNKQASSSNLSCDEFKQAHLSLKQTTYLCPGTLTFISITSKSWRNLQNISYSR